MKRHIAKISIVIVLLTIILTSMSCRSGYGCRGKESWNKMTKRINKGY